MFATARHACAFGLAGAVVLGGSTSAFASDDAVRSLPKVDFTLASNVPFVPSVTAVIPPAFLRDAAEEPSPAPIAEAPQTRPVDLAIPRGEGGSFDTGLRRSMYVSFAALQIMDGVSTRKALSSGGTEANPAMAGIARNSAALFAVKAGTAAVTTYLAERLAKNHPRRATILMAVLNTAYAAIVAHNYRVANAR